MASTLSATRGAVLVLTLVHPDFLPPLHAASRCFVDAGYGVEIVTFSSPATSARSEVPGVQFFDVGAHRGGLLERWRARRRFRAVAAERLKEGPVLVIASCPYTFIEARKLCMPNARIVYWAFELYEYNARDFARSPATSWRNWKARHQMAQATLVCAPSPERAGWLAARGRLLRLPTTVLNSQYLSPDPMSGSAQWPFSILPASFEGTPLVVNTGGLSRTQMVVELVHSMVHWPRDAKLVITNVGRSPYALQVVDAVEKSPRQEDIALLPLIDRDAMLSLQRRASVGTCLLRAGDNPETLMPAPNKVGEYLLAGLPVVGIRMPYLTELEHHGVAILADDAAPKAIGQAVTAALTLSRDPVTRQRIREVTRNWYCMNVQIRPMLRLIADHRTELVQARV